MSVDSFQAAVSFATEAPLELRSVSLDRPQADEVLVRVKACAICHSDLHYLSGAWQVPLPAVFGHEAAGEILALSKPSEGRAAGGKQAQNENEDENEDETLQVGDRVVVSLLRTCGSCAACARGEESLCSTRTRLDERSPLCLLEGEQAGTRLYHGLRTAAFAERVLLARSQVVKVSSSLDDDLACLLGCGVLTGFGAVMNVAMPHEGSHIITIGCGGVGLNCVQAARLTKPKTNIAIDPSRVKRVTAETLGATHTYSPSCESSQKLSQEVRAATRGGADFVFVAVGNVKAMTLGFDMLRPGGCMIVVGMTKAGEMLSLDASMLATEGKTVQGSKMGNACLARDIPKLLDLHARGLWNLEALAGTRFPFSEINDALQDARSEGALRSLVLH